MSIIKKIQAWYKVKKVQKQGAHQEKDLSKGESIEHPVSDNIVEFKVAYMNDPTNICYQLINIINPPKEQSGSKWYTDEKSIISALREEKNQLISRQLEITKFTNFIMEFKFGKDMTPDLIGFLSIIQNTDMRWHLKGTKLIVSSSIFDIREIIKKVHNSNNKFIAVIKSNLKYYIEKPFVYDLINDGYLPEDYEVYKDDEFLDTIDSGDYNLKIVALDSVSKIKYELGLDSKEINSITDCIKLIFYARSADATLANTLIAYRCPTVYLEDTKDLIAMIDISTLIDIISFDYHMLFEKRENKLIYELRVIEYIKDYLILNYDTKQNQFNPDAEIDDSIFNDEYDEIIE